MASMKKLYTPRARIAFAAITKPKKNDAGEDRWSCALLFTPAQFTPQEKALWQALHQEADEKLRQFQGKKGRQPRLPFRDGEEKVKEDGSFWDGFGPGVVYFNASTKRGPRDFEHPLTLVDASGEPLGPEAFYSGCYARAKLNAFTYESSGNRGVSFGLLGLQWLADGERFGGGQGFEDAPPPEGAHGAPPRRAPQQRQGSDEALAGQADDRPPEGAYSGPMDNEDIPF